MKKKKNSKEFNNRFKKKFITRKSVCVMAFTAIILLLVMIGCLGAHRKERQLQAVINQYTQDNEQIQKQNEEMEEEKSRIEEMNEAMTRGVDDEDSEDSIRQIAKNILGMIERDEYSLQESDSSK